MSKKMFNHLKIKELADEKKLKIKEMPEKIGIEKSRLYKLSRGHGKITDIEARKIADFFDVEIDYLYESSDKLENLLLYKDELYNTLKSENSYLKQMIAFLTDGKVKDELVKLKGSFTTAGDQCKVIAFGTSEVTPLANVG